MGYAVTYSRARIGIDAPLVTIETHISNGLPSFSIVGLPDVSVREARERVRSALINSQFVFPNQRITINLSPADIPKEGARFDLAIAMSILVASKQLEQQQIDQYEFLGELGLDGKLRGFIGEIPALVAAKQSGRVTIVPTSVDLVFDASHELSGLGADTLTDVFLFFKTQSPLKPVPFNTMGPSNDRQPTYPDLSDVIGQTLAKRALIIAAAGQHNLLMVGPPGTGKSMLAQRLSGILPPLTSSEALQVASIYSVAGKSYPSEQWYSRPFRSPHHTASAAALVGGGSFPRPGEISLAHHGVLFLDELPEFPRKVLDVLREPMESHKVMISRAAQQVEFPAQFQLIAALNPSPTGRLDDGRSSTTQILNYLGRLSGPFLDRIDLQVDVSAVPGSLLNHAPEQPSSDDVRAKVIETRNRMLSRCGKPNANMTPQDLRAHCQISEADSDFLAASIEQLNLSARVTHRILKLARTIADLASSEQIERQHLAEALSYRAMDRIISELQGL